MTKVLVVEDDALDTELVSVRALTAFAMNGDEGRLLGAGFDIKTRKTCMISVKEMEKYAR